MEKRKISTNLVGKEEIFKLLALGECTKLPVLLVGVPGVAKTQALMDYAAAKYGQGEDKELNKKKLRESCFVIELDEGTKTSEIKGRVDMKELLENKTYKHEAPIADAEFILINEVDKGSSGVRNTMLSVMRERALFLGSEVRRCNWTVFAGSCNEITTENSDAPFWDRFVLKQKVDRIQLGKLAEVWNGKKTEFDINIPTPEEVAACPVNPVKIEIFAGLIYNDITDRTCTYIPKIVKAIKLIWNVSDTQALVKACELISPGNVTSIASKLEDPRVSELKSKIAQIKSIDDISYLQTFMENIADAIKEMETVADMAEDVLELKNALKREIGKNKVLKEIANKGKSKAEQTI